jgi:hypothetical protein
MMIRQRCTCRLRLCIGSHRKGSLFPSVMIYMTISTVMAGLCGFALHMMLRSDRADRQAMLMLTTLERVDTQLRRDNQFATLQPVTASDVRFSSSESTVIHWNADRGILVRTESKEEDVVRREKYIFPAGTNLLFRSEDPDKLILQIEDPSAFVAYPASSSGGAQPGKPIPAIPDGAGKRPPVEILLRTRTIGTEQNATSAPSVTKGGMS